MRAQYRTSEFAGLAFACAHSPARRAWVAIISPAAGPACVWSRDYRDFYYSGTHTTPTQLCLELLFVRGIFAAPSVLLRLFLEALLLLLCLRQHARQSPTGSRRELFNITHLQHLAHRQQPRLTTSFPPRNNCELIRQHTFGTNIRNPLIEIEKRGAVVFMSGSRATCFRHLYIKVIILPRQARDKHRENSKKMPFFAPCRWP